MRLLFAVAAIATVSAGSASAQDSVSAFQSFCLDTGAQSARALAGADQAGWRPMPASDVAELAQLADVNGGEGRVQTTAFGALVLLTGRTPDEGDGLVGEHCNVFSFGRADVADAAARIGAWVGFPAVQAGDQNQWHFVVQEGRRVDLADATSDSFTATFGIMTMNQPNFSRHEISRLQLAR